jgi:hypothetical protein
MVKGISKVRKHPKSALGSSPYKRNIRDRLMATSFEQNVHGANPDHQPSRLDPRLMLGGHVGYGHIEHVPSGSVKAFHDRLSTTLQVQDIYLPSGSP